MNSRWPRVGSQPQGWNTKVIELHSSAGLWMKYSNVYLFLITWVREQMYRNIFYFLLPQGGHLFKVTFRINVSFCEKTLHITWVCRSTLKDVKNAEASESELILRNDSVLMPVLWRCRRLGCRNKSHHEPCLTKCFSFFFFLFLGHSCWHRVMPTAADLRWHGLTSGDTCCGRSGDERSVACFLNFYNTF